MRKSLYGLLAIAPLSLCGCGVMRNIEQWKCDRLGMCHFGTTPSQPMMAPPGAYCPPASPYGQPNTVQMPGQWMGLEQPLEEYGGW
jgi:hypothetical protein